MQITNPENDLVINYDVQGENVVRSFTGMMGQVSKKVFSKPEARADVRDFLENYEYRRIA